MELYLETFDLKAMIQELVAAIEAIVRKNGNTLAVTLDDDLGSMHADLVKTRQILFNLLSNAAKFTANGAVSLHVSRAAMPHGSSIKFVVSDTGIGLTDE